MSANAECQTFIEFILKGDSAFVLQDYKEASMYYTEAINADSSKYDGYFRRGQAYFYSEQDKNAIKDYDKALKLNPGDHRILHLRGKSKKFIGDISGALSDMNAAIETDSSYVIAYIDRAYVFASINQWEMAWIYFNYAIELDPNQPANIYFSRGYGYQIAKAYRQALADYKKAIELDPSNLDAYLNAGNSLIELKEFDRAIEMYNSGLIKKPDDGRLHFGKACSYIQKEQMEKACVSFQRAKQLNLKKADAEIEKYCK
jgi:tetratricopeptide (TPR) repeat protein